MEERHNLGKWIKIISISFLLIICVSCNNDNVSPDLSGEENDEKSEKLSSEKKETKLSKEEEAQRISETLYPISDDDGANYSFINSAGEIVIKGPFEYANYFSDGVAQVRKNGELYFINGFGEKQFKIDYLEVGDFFDGYAAFAESLVPNSDDGDVRYGFIDKKGNIVINPIYYNITRFSEGMALGVKRIEDDQQEVHLIKQDGTFENILTIPHDEFVSVIHFENGYAEAALVESDIAYVIDQKSRVEELDFNVYMEVGMLRDGMRTFKDFDNNGGYIDAHGREIVEPSFQDVTDFSNGFAAVRLHESGWTFINKKGQMITNKLFDYVSEFNDGLASVEIDGLWGAIDEKGKIVIEPQFSQSLYFINGVSSAIIGYKEGYINKEGKFIVSPHTY